MRGPTRRKIAAARRAGRCPGRKKRALAMGHRHYWVPVSIGLVGHVGREVHGAGGVSIFDGHSGGDSGTRSNSLTNWIGREAQLSSPDDIPAPPSRPAKHDRQCWRGRSCRVSDCVDIPTLGSRGPPDCPTVSSASNRISAR